MLIEGSQGVEVFIAATALTAVPGEKLGSIVRRVLGFELTDWAAIAPQRPGDHVFAKPDQICDRPDGKIIKAAGIRAD